jgi:hypothetical protein
MPYLIHPTRSTEAQAAHAQSAQANSAMPNPGFGSSQEEDESRKVSPPAGAHKEEENHRPQSDHLDDLTDSCQYRSVWIAWKYRWPRQTPPELSNNSYTLAH